MKSIFQKSLEKLRKLRDAVTTSETLTEYTMKGCSIISPNNFQL